MIRSAITSSTDVKTINSSWQCYLHDLCSVLFPISFRMLLICVCLFHQRRNRCGYYNANTVVQNTDVHLRLREMTIIFHEVWVCGCVYVSGFFVCLSCMNVWSMWISVRCEWLHRRILDIRYIVCLNSSVYIWLII